MSRVEAARKTRHHYRRWSPKDDRNIGLLWTATPLASIARELGRTEISVYWRARELGLPIGAPQGFEYLTDAARRTGFATSQLRRVLRANGVAITRTLSRPGVVSRLGGAPGRHFHCVDPIDVDDAVAAWTREESVEGAALRRGVSGDVLRRLLLKAGHAPPRRRKAHWRIPSHLADELVAAWRAKGVSVRAHAARLGLGRDTLAGWLRGAGLIGPKQPGVEVTLSSDVVDGVVEARLARPGCRAKRAA